MDYGISALTDDQLIELLAQACGELGTREFHVRRLAQQTIIDGAEKLRVAEAAAVCAIERAINSYVLQINAEVAKEVGDAIKTGAIRLVSPAQEADIVAVATLRAKIGAAKELIAKMEKGDERFFVEVEPGDHRREGMATVCCGSVSVKVPCALSQSRLKSLATYLASLFETPRDREPASPSDPALVIPVVPRMRP